VSTSELVRQLVNLIRAKNASTFYLNGSPGSGKSYLLRKLAEQLPSEIPRSLPLGPHAATESEFTSLGERLLQDCQDAGFLDKTPPVGLELDLASAWQWFGRNAQVPSGRSFLVLIDLVKANQINLPAIGNLFSNARYLEGVWNHRGVRLFHMFVGYWDHPGLAVCRRGSFGSS